mmetsp:Transcript_38102/g.108791  ORF Transcript_38102/g.108791 Transcript_38102/m.108791 type:complete len:311 (+) Transcript_38102:646-1578(+)
MAEVLVHRLVLLELSCASFECLGVLWVFLEVCLELGRVKCLPLQLPGTHGRDGPLGDATADVLNAIAKTLDVLQVQRQRTNHRFVWAAWRALMLLNLVHEHLVLLPLTDERQCRPHRTRTGRATHPVQVSLDGSGHVRIDDHGHILQVETAVDTKLRVGHLLLLLEFGRQLFIGHLLVCLLIQIDLVAFCVSVFLIHIHFLILIVVDSIPASIPTLIPIFAEIDIVKLVALVFLLTLGGHLFWLVVVLLLIILFLLIGAVLLCLDVLQLRGAAGWSRGVILLDALIRRYQQLKQTLIERLDDGLSACVRQ